MSRTLAWENDLHRPNGAKQIKQRPISYQAKIKCVPLNEFLDKHELIFSNEKETQK